MVTVNHFYFVKVIILRFISACEASHIYYLCCPSYYLPLLALWGGNSGGAHGRDRGRDYIISIYSRRNYYRPLQFTLLEPFFVAPSDTDFDGESCLSDVSLLRGG